jgi:GNAT superfamily N-acetyltransferase
VMSSGTYPSQYEAWLALNDGRKVFVRPIKPTDDHLLVDMFNKMSPESRYLRFMSTLHALPEELLHHFTHINYDTEFALAALTEEDEKDAIIAVGRYMLEPPETVADLAIAVRDDWQHLGLGTQLLGLTIKAGKEHGISKFGA